MRKRPWNHRIIVLAAVCGLTSLVYGSWPSSPTIPVLPRGKSLDRADGHRSLPPRSEPVPIATIPATAEPVGAIPAARAVDLLEPPMPHMKSAALHPSAAALRRLALRDPGLSVRWASGRPSPSFLRGKLSDPSAASPREIADRFLAENGSLWGMADPERELALDDARSTLQPDEGGVASVEYAQSLQGVPVEGHSMQVHVRADGVVRAVTAHFQPGLLERSLDPTPTIPASWMSASVRQTYALAGDPDLLTEPTLVWYMKNGAPTLCWRSQVVAPERGIGVIYFLDATTGAVAGTVSTADCVEYSTYTTTSDVTGTGRNELGGSFSINLRKRTQVVTSGGSIVSTSTSYLLQDHSRDAVIRCYDMGYASGLSSSDFTSGISSSDTTFYAWDEKMEANAHFNMGQVLDWWSSVIDRNGWNGSGGDCYLGLHARYEDDDGTLHGRNAKSLGSGYFTFGDGSPNYSFTWLDVCGHEFTHAVVGNEVSLGSGAQAKALNEHFADVFGVFVEQYWGNSQGDKNWKIGEEIYGLDSSGNYYGSIRNLETNTTDHYAEYSSSADSHTNCRIPNHACYLLSEGGTHRDSDLSVNGIGVTATRKIWWRALKTYLPDSPDFGDLREAAISAAEDLYSTQGYDRNVEMAFNAVGILEYAIDLVRHAEAMAWTSSSGSPTFGSGTSANTVGYVTATLEDGTTGAGSYDQLAVFPPSTSSGYIFGTAYLKVPSSILSLHGIFRGTVGFERFSAIPTGSKGGAASAEANVYLTFIPEDTGSGDVVSANITRNGALDTLELDLSAYAGKWGTFYVTVMNPGTATTNPIIWDSLSITYGF